MGIQKDSVRDQVRRTLTERILAGHYKPGDRLVELQIARELGTSQGSVREALRELEASRLVESEPRRGTRVRVVSLKELQDAYFARGILEQAAAATAAKAFKGNVEKLRQEFQGILDAAEARDLGEQAAHVYALHRMIVEASGNCVLLRLWESLAFETRARVRLGVGDRYGASQGILRSDPRSTGKGRLPGVCTPVAGTRRVVRADRRWGSVSVGMIDDQCG